MTTMARLLLFVLATVLCGFDVPVASRTLYFVGKDVKPQQIHISYGASPSEMTVTWNTKEAPDSPVAQFGNPNRIVAAVSKLFTDGGTERRTQYIHRAILTGLKPGQRYWYRVGSKDASWSPTFSFRAMRTDAKFAPRFAVYGDMGLINPQSLPRLTADMRKDMYDAVLHVGDFAYDMAWNNSKVGDAFMNVLQPLSANLPYMTCPGNHEHHYNFSNYKARFSMPGDNGKMFYSFDIGPAHIVSISTEYYYYVYYGITQISQQYRWLENDLKAANANRAKRPWIILMGHRPMYCSNDDGDCALLTRLLRNGLWFIYDLYPGLEPLLKKYGVDLAIWGHEHSYERMWPVYNNTVLNGTTPGKPYIDPGATVHVVTGSAGCRERHDTFGSWKNFTAFRSSDYGYSRMQILNATHLAWEQVSDDKHGKVIDNFVLVRNKHTPF